MRDPRSYWDGVRGRLLVAVLVGLGAAGLLFLLDDDLTAVVLVGVVTLLSVALVPTPEERARRA
ncbi:MULTISPECIES: hypothetical protein [unclassified Geodermatophilus]